MGKRLILILCIAAVALTVLIVWLFQGYPDALSSEYSQLNLVRSLLLLGLLGSSAVLHRRFKGHSTLKHLGIWLLIGAVLFVGYTFRHDVEYVWRRVLAELMPSSGMVEGGEVSFPVSAGGHFVVEAYVDNVPVRFLVDTGASDVILSPSDAERLGFDLTRLRFNKIYQTANGTVMGAPVTLGRVSIGIVNMERVRATVNGAAMDRSLLGMSFLGRLSSYSVSRDVLTLRP